jgi:hypothetical protein
MTARRPRSGRLAFAAELHPPGGLQLGADGRRGAAAAFGVVPLRRPIGSVECRGSRVESHTERRSPVQTLAAADVSSWAWPRSGRSRPMSRRSPMPRSRALWPVAPASRRGRRSRDPAGRGSGSSLSGQKRP